MMKADREIKEALESWGTAAMADCWSVDSRRSISVPQALAWRVASTRMTGRTAPDASSPCAATTGVADLARRVTSARSSCSWVLAEHAWRN
jgi:hypothetical protein